MPSTRDENTKNTAISKTDFQPYNLPRARLHSCCQRLQKLQHAVSAYDDYDNASARPGPPINVAERPTRVTPVLHRSMVHSSTRCDHPRIE